MIRNDIMRGQDIRKVDQSTAVQRYRCYREYVEEIMLWKDPTYYNESLLYYIIQYSGPIAHYFMNQFAWVSQSAKTKLLESRSSTQMTCIHHAAASNKINFLEKIFKDSGAEVILKVFTYFQKEKIE